jgi:hypothetical protein
MVKAIELGGDEYYKDAMAIYENEFISSIKMIPSAKDRKGAITASTYYLSELLGYARKANRSSNRVIRSVGEKVLANQKHYRDALSRAQKSDLVKAFEFIWGVGVAINEACKAFHGGKCPPPQGGMASSKPYDTGFGYNDAAGSMLYLQAR